MHPSVHNGNSAIGVRARRSLQPGVSRGAFAQVRANSGLSLAFHQRLSGDIKCLTLCSSGQPRRSALSRFANAVPPGLPLNKTLGLSQYSRHNAKLAPFFNPSALPSPACEVQPGLPVLRRSAHARWRLHHNPQPSCFASPVGPVRQPSRATASSRPCVAHGRQYGAYRWQPAPIG